MLKQNFFKPFTSRVVKRVSLVDGVVKQEVVETIVNRSQGTEFICFRPEWKIALGNGKYRSAKDFKWNKRLGCMEHIDYISDNTTRLYPIDGEDNKPFRF